MGLADDLLEDARHLSQRGAAEYRQSCMRRAVSTSYYAVFHLFVEDFVTNWPFADQRGRLARMFDHRKMREAAITPEDKKNPTLTETNLIEIKISFWQLQADRNRADYDLAWGIVETDAANAVILAEKIFAKWRAIHTEDAARHYLLSMFGANR